MLPKKRHLTNCKRNKHLKHKLHHSTQLTATFIFRATGYIQFWCEGFSFNPEATLSFRLCIQCHFCSLHSKKHFFLALNLSTWNTIPISMPTCYYSVLKLPESVNLQDRSRNILYLTIILIFFPMPFMQFVYPNMLTWTPVQIPLTLRNISNTTCLRCKTDRPDRREQDT